MKRRAGTIALRSEGDIVFYALGTGEYDELNCEAAVRGPSVTYLVSKPETRSYYNHLLYNAVAETIRAVSLGLRDTIRKPTEAALFDGLRR